MSRSTSWFQRESASLILGAVVLALFVLPRNTAALIPLLAAVVAPAVILLMRGGGVRGLTRQTWLLLGLSGALAALLGVTAAFATSPAVSFWGARGQHTGAVMWIAVAACLAATVATRRADDAVRVARAVAVTGAVLGLAALLERYGLLLTVRLSDSPSGLMENSISLSQMMIVGLGAAVAWASRSRSLPQRVVAWASFAVMLAGLTVSRTRAAWLALAVAGLVLGAMWLLRRTKASSSAVTASLVVGVAVVALSVTWWLGTVGIGGDPLVVKIDDLLSGRVGIWSAAVDKAGRHALTGSGPEQFTAWAAWDSVPGQSMEYMATDDPHSILLYWLLAAGLPGLLGALAVLWFASERVASSIARSSWQVGDAALAWGLGAWLFSLLFAWMSPLALLCAAVLLGAVVGELEQEPVPDNDEFTGRWLSGVIASVVGLLVIAVAIPTVQAEVIWASALRDGVAPEIGEALRLSDISGNPVYAVAAGVALHDQILATRDDVPLDRFDEAARDMIEPHAVWSVSAAMVLNNIAADAAVLRPDEGWEPVAASIEVAKRTEPTTGLWDYMAAIEALSVSNKSAAAEHARAALEFPLPDAVRAWCLEQSGETGS